MTKLVHFSPLSESRDLQSEFDRMFDSFFPGVTRRESERTHWTPRLDFVELEDAFVIDIDAPGMDKEEFEIGFHDGKLSVSGERAAAEGSEDTKTLRAERRFGRFARTFALIGCNTAVVEGIRPASGGKHAYSSR